MITSNVKKFSQGPTLEMTTLITLNPQYGLHCSPYEKNRTYYSR